MDKILRQVDSDIFANYPTNLIQTNHSV